MSLIIRKYGGSSVANNEKIKSIAEQIKIIYDEGHQIIVVVSAMGKSTDDLLNSAHQITKNPDLRELDMLLSIGERKSISLMALALIDLGIPTISLTGSQIGLITDNNHGNAQIIEIKGDRIEKELKNNKVIVVAGYQGVSLNKEITTLGRGGTDTTAIALAARLDADRCELMKDVDGLYSVPIEFIHQSYLRKQINFKELNDYSEAGLQILSKDAMKIASKKQIKISIGNTYTNRIGTILENTEKVDQGIHQIIEAECVALENKLKEPFDRRIYQNGKSLFLYFNPISIHKKKTHMMLSIFGKKLNQINLYQIFAKDIFIFSNATDEKIEFLFTLETYNLNKKQVNQYLQENLK